MAAKEHHGAGDVLAHSGQRLDFDAILWEASVP